MYESFVVISFQLFKRSRSFTSSSEFQTEEVWIFFSAYQMWQKTETEIYFNAFFRGKLIGTKWLEKRCKKFLQQCQKSKENLHFNFSDIECRCQFGYGLPSVCTYWILQSQLTNFLQLILNFFFNLSRVPREKKKSLSACDQKIFFSKTIYAPKIRVAQKTFLVHRSPSYKVFCFITAYFHYFSVFPNKIYKKISKKYHMACNIFALFDFFKWLSQGVSLMQDIRYTHFEN